jgi:hypothetical protein
MVAPKLFHRAYRQAAFREDPEDDFFAHEVDWLNLRHKYCFLTF